MILYCISYLLFSRKNVKYVKEQVDGKTMLNQTSDSSAMRKLNTQSPKETKIGELATDQNLSKNIHEQICVEFSWNLPQTATEVAPWRCLQLEEPLHRYMLQRPSVWCLQTACLRGRAVFTLVLHWFYTVTSKYVTWDTQIKTTWTTGWCKATWILSLPVKCINKHDEQNDATHAVVSSQIFIGFLFGIYWCCCCWCWCYLLVVLGCPGIPVRPLHPRSALWCWLILIDFLRKFVPLT